MTFILIFKKLKNIYIYFKINNLLLKKFKKYIYFKINNLLLKKFKIYIYFKINNLLFKE